MPRHWTLEGSVPLCLHHSKQTLREENISRKGLFLPEVSQAFSQASSTAYHSQARKIFGVWTMKPSTTEWLTMKTRKRTGICMQGSDSRAEDFLPLWRMNAPARNPDCSRKQPYCKGCNLSIPHLQTLIGLGK